MLELNFNNFPLLETERLTLRRTLITDAEALFKLRSDVHAMRYLDRPLATLIEEANELIEKIESGIMKSEAIGWAISEKHGAKLIGTIGFHKIDKPNHRAEIGYMLNPQYWHHGLMNEAVKAVLNFGFNGMQLHSVEAQVNPGNDSSIKLLSKFNFQKEGYFKENYFYDGNFFDTVVFYLLSQQFNQ